MHRRLALCALASATILLAAPGAALAGGDDDDDHGGGGSKPAFRPGDTVFGTGTAPGTGARFTVAATTLRSGRVIGFASIANASQIALTAGPVTCLRVEGNRAAVGFRITRAVPESLEGQYRELFIEDAGPTGDLLRQRLPSERVPTCDLGAVTRPIDDGNFWLIDGEAAVTAGRSLRR